MVYKADLLIELAIHLSSIQYLYAILMLDSEIGSFSMAIRLISSWFMMLVKRISFVATFLSSNKSV